MEFRAARSAAAVVDGKIHAVGGSAASVARRPAHEVYDPAVKKWNRWRRRSRRHAMVTWRRRRSAALCDRCGTNGRSGTSSGSTRPYDPANDRWEKRAAMPTAAAEVRRLRWRDAWFVVGGGRRRRASIGSRRMIQRAKSLA